MTIPILVVLGLSFGSIAYAQEARWEELIDQVEALYHQGKYREAIPVAKEALKVAEHTFGPEHPNAATSLFIIATLYDAQGRFAQAEPLYKRALEILEKTMPNHPYVAGILNNLAELYIKMGRKDEAVPLLNRARKIQLGL